MQSLDFSKQLSFAGIDSTTGRTMRDHADLIKPALDEAMAAFYRQVDTEPTVSKYFAGQAAKDRALAKQQQYWNNFLGGELGAGFIANARRVGEVHAQIGITPDWHIAGYSVIFCELVRCLAKTIDVEDEDGLTPEKFGDVAAVLAKTVFMDIAIVTEVYRASLAAKAAELEAVRAREDEEQAVLLSCLTNVIESLADGDLTARIDQPLAERFEEIRATTNDAVSRLMDQIDLMRQTGENVIRSSDEIRRAMGELSQRTVSQAASLEETNAAIQQLNTSVRETAEGAGDAATESANAMTEAEKGQEIVGRTITAMGAISKSSGDINDKLTMINEIAFQTNLLSLNAAVEAARAGDAGRGFAIVAQEVRRLSDSCATAAKEIKELIDEGATYVENGVSLTEEAGRALEGISKKVVSADSLARVIADGAKDQASNLSEVTTTISNLDEITQRNAAMAEQTNGRLEKLGQDIDTLNQSLALFRTLATTGGHAHPAARSVA